MKSPHEIVEGGPHTRKDPATGSTSCLDLFVVSRETLPFIKKLLIDNAQKMTPARATKKKGKVNLIYTDHYSLMLTLEDLPKKQEKREEKKSMLNISKENGWGKNNTSI